MGPPKKLCIWVMDINGKNRKPVNKWGGDRGIDWAPDGDKIVFCSFQDSWNNWRSNDIYVINANGTGEKRLTQPGPTIYYNPIWSPTGTEIAFTADQGGNWHLYVMNADGSNVRQLTNTPLNDQWCGFDWFAFSSVLKPGGKLPTTWGETKTN